jgi:hypothetical protein
MNDTIFFFDVDNSTTMSDNKNLNEILFIIVLCLSIPSILINLFAIYRLHRNTKLSVFVFRCILHVSLFTTLTCIPFFLIELYFNPYFPLPSIVCQIWLIIDYSSIVCLGLLVCWASIQRHILIFGPIHIKKLQSTLKFKLIPCLFTLSFPLTWYSILIFRYPCDNMKMNKFQCRPCFEDKETIFLIDTLLSLLLPLLVTICATSFLLIRIVRLRLTLFRSNSKKWRRCKRLTRQMLLFSFIYLIGLLPYVLTNFNSLYNFCPFFDLSWSREIADVFSYVPCCFSSFLSIYAFPEIWNNQPNRHHNHQNSLRVNRKPRRISITLPTSSSTEA